MALNEFLCSEFLGGGRREKLQEILNFFRLFAMNMPLLDRLMQITIILANFFCILGVILLKIWMVNRQKLTNVTLALNCCVIFSA